MERGGRLGFSYSSSRFGQFDRNLAISRATDRVSAPRYCGILGLMASVARS